MPGRQSMRRIKDCLRLRFEQGMSQRQVARAVHMARSTVGECWQRFDRVGLRWDQALKMNEAELEGCLYSLSPISGNTNERVGELDFEYLHRELQRPGVTMQVLWEEYLKERPQGYRYSQFCRRYREWAQRLRVYMRQIHKGGEKIYVDYSGKKPCLVNVQNGEIRKQELFVMPLGDGVRFFV